MCSSIISTANVGFITTIGYQQVTLLSFSFYQLGVYCETWVYMSVGYFRKKSLLIFVTSLA